MTGRAAPRIGYLSFLAARAAPQSLRPPRRLFGPVFTESPAAEPPAPVDYRGPDDPAASRPIGPGEPGHRPSLAHASRSSGGVGRPAAARSGGPAFGALLSADPSQAGADAIAPRQRQPSPPAPGESRTGRRAVDSPQPVLPPWPEAVLGAPAGRQRPASAGPTGTAGPAEPSSSGRQADPGQAGPGLPAVAGHLAADRQAPGQAPSREGPSGARQPFVVPGQPHLSPPAPSREMTDPPAHGSPRAPRPGASLSIGTIEVTVLPPPAAPVPRPPSRPAAARPSRSQPPARLTRGYGPGFGQGQG